MKSMFGVEVRDGVVGVVDLRGVRSVTNDAEAVIEYLKTRFDLENMRVVYQDSQGTWDGMAVKNGHFAGFVPIGVNTMDEAIEAAKSREKWGP